MTDNIDRGHSGTKRRNRNRPTAKPGNGPVASVTVDPLIWRQGFPIDHLLVIGPAVVIVCNSRRHRDYMRKVLRDV